MKRDKGPKDISFNIYRGSGNNSNEIIHPGQKIRSILLHISGAIILIYCILMLILQILAPYTIFQENYNESVDYFIGSGDIGSTGAMLTYFIFLTILIIAFGKLLQEEGRGYFGFFSVFSVHPRSKRPGGQIEGVRLKIQRSRKEIRRPTLNTYNRGKDALKRPFGKKATEIAQKYPFVPRSTPKSESPDRSSSRTTDNSFILISFMVVVVLILEFLFDLLYSHYDIEVIDPNFLKEGPFYNTLYSIPIFVVLFTFFIQVFLIGIPLFLFNNLGPVSEDQGIPENDHTTSYRELSHRLFTRSNRRYILGGSFSIDARSIILLIFSSIFFCLAYGATHGTQLPIMIIISMAAGYMFLKKGLHSSLIFTFLILSIVQIGREVESDPLLHQLHTIVILFLIGVSAFTTMLSLKKIYKKIITALSRISRKKINRGIAAVGGTAMLACGVVTVLVVMSTVFIEGNETYEESRTIRFQEGDYQVFTYGSEDNSIAVSGKISINGSGYIELFGGDEYAKDSWMAGEGDARYGNFDIYNQVRATPEDSNKTVSGELQFELRLDANETFYLILRAKEDTNCTYTTSVVAKDYVVLSVFSLICFLPVAIILLVCGFGSIYMSNDKQFLPEMDHETILEMYASLPGSDLDKTTRDSSKQGGERGE